MIDWRTRTCWLFDMDGTLTVPAHDFAHARRRLGVPDGVDILDHIASLSLGARQEAERWLHLWELEIAQRSRPQDDALALVLALQRAGCKLGVLTRNTRDNALRTLQVIGMGEVFAPEHTLGRDCAPPKPHPGGIHLLLDRLGATAASTVMVGDYIHDVRAGRRAGTATLLIDRGDASGWEDEADLLVSSLWPLPAMLPGG
jgi:HAD superfamily hydrolase (TIGR01549 family)